MKALFVFTCFFAGCTVKQEMPEKSDYADSISLQAYNYLLRGRYADAAKFYEQALKEYVKIDHRLGIARVSANLSTAYYELGKFEQAKNLSNQALAIFKSLNDYQNVHQVTLNLGAILNMQGDSGALKLFEQVLGVAQEKSLLRAKCLVGICLAGLKDEVLVRKMGGYLGEAEAIFKEVNYEAGMGSINFVRGILARSAGDMRKSAELLLSALEADKKQSSAVSLLRDLEELVLTYESINAKSARDYCSRALSIARTLGLKERVKRLEVQLARLTE